MSTYSISDLSSEFDITPRTLRFYEEKGLLNPKRQGKNRIYSQGDRVRLKLILRGKRLGFSLQESHDIIRMYNPRHSNSGQLHALLEKIQQKCQALEQQKHDIEQLLNDLRDSKQRCLQALKTSS